MAADDDDNDDHDCNLDRFLFLKQISHGDCKGLCGSIVSRQLAARTDGCSMIVEGMQSFEDDRQSVVKPACALKPAKAGTSSVSYAALRMAYVAVAKLRGLSEKA